MIMGVSAFTSEDISDPQPILDDHPYGSLILLGNTRQAVDPVAATASKSTLLFGLLGTNLAHEMQDFFHGLTDTEKAQGRDNQISDGGEPTFRYEFKRHVLLDSGRAGENTRYDLRWSTGARSDTAPKPLSAPVPAGVGSERNGGVSNRRRVSTCATARHGAQQTTTSAGTSDTSGSASRGI